MSPCTYLELCRPWAMGPCKLPYDLRGPCILQIQAFNAMLSYLISLRFRYDLLSIKVLVTTVGGRNCTAAASGTQWQIGIELPNQESQELEVLSFSCDLLLDSPSVIPCQHFAPVSHNNRKSNVFTTYFISKRWPSILSLNFYPLVRYRVFSGN